MERRTINIPKEDFDYIKEYCNENTLNMPQWVVKIIKEKIGELKMFRKIIFSKVTKGDYFVVMCFTKDNKQINIKFDGLLYTKLCNNGIKFNDNDLIRCMAYEAFENGKDFFIEEENYTDEWKNFEIDEDCIIEIIEGSPGIGI